MASQPALVVWKLPSGRRHHYLDVLVHRDVGHTVACEVTRRDKLSAPDVLAQFTLMAATAEAAGWDFELRTELPAQRVRNQAHLHACRMPQSLPSQWRQRLDALSWPAHLETVAQMLGAAPAGMTRALHLIAAQHLFLDFDLPLRADTELYRQPIRKEHPWLTQL